MWLYHLLFPIGFLAMLPTALPRLLRRGRATAGLGERFGCYHRATRDKLAGFSRPVWIHAVSVGEVMLARVLLRELRQLRPNLVAVVTCTTATGRAIAQRHLEDERTVILATPIDAWGVVQRAFRLIRPAMLVLVEQEIWPAQMERAAREGVPVWIINARLSDRSWRRMRRWRHWLTRLLRPVVFVGLQRESDRSRLAEAGFPPHALFFTGSMKSDVAALPGGQEHLPEQVRRALGWDDANPVVLGGSTHPGEEKLLLDGFRQWRARHPALRLFLAPRHAERAEAVVELVRQAGFSVTRRSHPQAGADVAVLDTTGELRSLYPLATVVVMGKSFIAPEGKGGQNFLEAAQAGCAVVCGPRLENFRALADEYLSAGAMRQVPDATVMTAEVARLLDHPQERHALGARAQELFRSELGVGRAVATRLIACLK